MRSMTWRAVFMSPCRLERVDLVRLRVHHLHQVVPLRHLGLGFRAHILGFRVQGLGFRV